ncbi:MAG: hypothetical protein KBT03_12980 [Bacteroidales bacterium]|nr:hypothetical protein [Candidatus Scybalousia scybalohippi]
MIWNNSLYGITRNAKFTEIYEDVDSFIEDYHTNGLPNTIDDFHAATLFYLLFGQYGYSTIISPNVDQWKYKLFSVIFMYGPAWEKKLKIQDDLTSLSIEEIQTGATQISQHGYNPGTAVSTPEEIESVDDQNKVHYKKSKIEGYANLLAVLKTDVTKEFLDKFKKLFKVVVAPELPLWYETQVIEEGEED